MEGMPAQLTLAPAGLLWIPVTHLLRCGWEAIDQQEGDVIVASAYKAGTT